MNAKQKLVASALGVTGTLLISAIAVALLTCVRVDNQSEKLCGSWNVENKIQQGIFPALLTFTADGSVIADESPELFESTGHGSWVSTGREGVAYTFMVLFGSQEGKNTGKAKVVGTLQFDAGTGGWQGPFKFESVDTTGKASPAIHGTFHLKRIAVEPMN
jgi:hypothetical protein